MGSFLSQLPDHASSLNTRRQPSEDLARVRSEEEEEVWEEPADLVSLSPVNGSFLHDNDDDDESLPAFAEYGTNSPLQGTLLGRTSAVDSPRRDLGTTSKVRKVASLLRRKPSLLGHTSSSSPIPRPAPSPSSPITFPSATLPSHAIPSSPRMTTSSGHNLSTASLHGSSTSSLQRGSGSGEGGGGSEEGRIREGRGSSGGTSGSAWRERGGRGSVDLGARGEERTGKGMAIPQPQSRGASSSAGIRTAS